MTISMHISYCIIIIDKRKIALVVNFNTIIIMYALFIYGHKLLNIQYFQYKNIIIFMT